MNILDEFARWAEKNRERLERMGIVKFTVEPPGRNKTCGILSLEAADFSMELLLWDSGEAEFNRGVTGGVPVLEHVDVDSPQSLSALLSRFLETGLGDHSDLGWTQA